MSTPFKAPRYARRGASVRVPNRTSRSALRAAVGRLKKANHRLELSAGGALRISARSTSSPVLSLTSFGGLSRVLKLSVSPFSIPSNILRIASKQVGSWQLSIFHPFCQWLRARCGIIDSTYMSSKENVPFKKIRAMLWPSLRLATRIIPIAIFFSIAIAVLNIAEPYIYGSIIDVLVQSIDVDALPKEAFAPLIPYLLYWAGVVILGALFSAVYLYAVWYYANKFTGEFARQSFARMLRLDVRRFHE